MNQDLKKIKELSRSIILATLWLSSECSAKAIHQNCDGEQKTCCVAEGFSKVPPMWVNGATCPQGMSDDLSCTIQYGCKQNDEPELN
ncbi:hypothetical protein [Legionella sp. km772]|uniref:hypothetical protein n=1 Tax=Legionella sp. km772 TaxID=2498111 RepID=UPI000F8E4D98|nr:hypothetical protein [Legionella sp. km772]RUR07603.1 hypothetical protein ELY15_12015 [Legionella sp. km772]